MLNRTLATTTTAAAGGGGNIAGIVVYYPGLLYVMAKRVKRAKNKGKLIKNAQQISIKWHRKHEGRKKIQ